MRKLNLRAPPPHSPESAVNNQPLPDTPAQMSEGAFSYWKEKERNARKQEERKQPLQPKILAPAPHLLEIPTKKPQSVLARRDQRERRLSASDCEPCVSKSQSLSRVSDLVEQLNLVLASPPPGYRPPSNHTPSPSTHTSSHTSPPSFCIPPPARNWRSTRHGTVMESGGGSGKPVKDHHDKKVKIRSSFISYLDGPIEPVVSSQQPKVDIKPSPGPSPPPHPPSPYHPSTAPPFTKSNTFSEHKAHHKSLTGTVSAPSLPPHHPPPPSTLKTISDSVRGKGDTLSRTLLIDCTPLSKEVSAFWDMVERVRSQCCPAGDGAFLTLTSPTISAPSTSVPELITVVMETNQDTPPALFRFSVDCKVEEIIAKGLRRCGLLTGTKGQRSPEQYCLKVCGRDEYFENSHCLREYLYVHECIKLSTEVRLVLVDKDTITTNFAKVDPGAPPPLPLHLRQAGCVPKTELSTLLHSYFAKEEKFRELLTEHGSLAIPVSVAAMAQAVVSCVKLLCERLSFIEPPDVTEAVFNLRRACRTSTQTDWQSSAKKQLMESVESWGDSDGNVQREVTSEGIQDILAALGVLQSAVKSLISIYCTSFQPGYLPVWDPGQWGSKVITSSQTQTLKVKVVALHRIISTQELRRFELFQLEVCVYHGGQVLSKRAFSPPTKMSRNFFSTIVWDKWINMGLSLAHIPREARICFTLHGLELPGSGYKWNRTPIGWVSCALFSVSGVLITGGQLLGLWLDENINPLDTPHSSLHSCKSHILQVAFEEYESVICFPEDLTDQEGEEQERKNERAPPSNIMHILKTIAQKDRFSSLTREEQDLVWKYRWSCPAHLSIYPRGLPSLLLSTPHWYSSHLVEVWKLVEVWPQHDPAHGLELLDGQFSDMAVRRRAVSSLTLLSDDDLCDILPQLVQSLRYDCYETSAMAELLLSHAASSPCLAHNLFWTLRLLCADERSSQRYKLMFAALDRVCGETLRLELANEVDLVDQLCSVAAAVKASRDAQRQTTLVQELRQLSKQMVESYRLPLNPAMHVRGIDIESCSFFNSNTVPLKLSFWNADPLGSKINVIFKMGDDLRQDILILQVLRMMEKIWLRVGLDLKMITYGCVATGNEQGMLEMVSEAETLRAIQVEHGLTGSFKDKPLAEWLQRHNPTDGAYKKAVENFTLSCAGYCVATYVLGICDRHNDNIMVKRSGHMFHIDFGKILGNAQMFGSIKRDRAPFVLTPDMAYVINQGEKQSGQLQEFTHLCCKAYNELRRHSNLILSLLSLMVPSGIAELSSADDLGYVRDALLPGKTEGEAKYAFTKHIEASLGSLATQINFFIHNLAQFKSSSSSSSASTGLLSFSRASYSIATDGQVQSATITNFHKRFYPDTYTVYEIEVSRVDSDRPSTTIFRRYREFNELQNKLVQCFPEEPLPLLPGKIYVPGKSHSRQTAEKRQLVLNRYLEELLAMEPHISESDVVYTFLHCLLRDEQDFIRMEEENGPSAVGDRWSCVGKVKVNLKHDAEKQRLSVIVQHVKDLVPREGVELADPYVKLYLLPDPDKETKRKTRIIRKNLNPTFNETFCFTLPESRLKRCSLQLSVWDASALFTKHCLAVTAIDLHRLKVVGPEGVSKWFDLNDSATR